MTAATVAIEVVEGWRSSMVLMALRKAAARTFAHPPAEPRSPLYARNLDPGDTFQLNSRWCGAGDTRGPLRGQLPTQQMDVQLLRLPDHLKR